MNKTKEEGTAMNFKAQRALGAYQIERTAAIRAGSTPEMADFVARKKIEEKFGEQVLKNALSEKKIEKAASAEKVMVVDSFAKKDAQELPDHFKKFEAEEEPAFVPHADWKPWVGSPEIQFIDCEQCRAYVRANGDLWHWESYSPWYTLLANGSEVTEEKAKEKAEMGMKLASSMEQPENKIASGQDIYELFFDNKQVARGNEEHIRNAVQALYPFDLEAALESGWEISLVGTPEELLEKRIADLEAKIAQSADSPGSRHVDMEGQRPLSSEPAKGTGEPDLKAQAEEPEMSVAAMLVKQAVDKETKDYWTKYFGEYGTEQVKDQALPGHKAVASVEKEAQALDPLAATRETSMMRFTKPLEVDTMAPFYFAVPKGQMPASRAMTFDVKDSALHGDRVELKVGWDKKQLAGLSPTQIMWQIRVFVQALGGRYERNWGTVHDVQFVNMDMDKAECVASFKTSREAPIVPEFKSYEVRSKHEIAAMKKDNE